MSRGLGETKATVREILTDRERLPMRHFLVAYLVYQDGVNTVTTFSAVFAAKTLGFSFEEIIQLFLVIQIAGLIGSAASAKPTDARGPKVVVMAALLQWVVVTTLAYFVQLKWHFWIVAVLAGVGLGAIQAASRTLMATLVPAGREAEFFGFYSLVGKVGAIFGPLLFGAISATLQGNQRAAILAIGLFFAAGLYLMQRVPAGGPIARPQTR